MQSQPNELKSSPKAMSTLTKPIYADWQITDKGHVVHRSGLGFRILPGRVLEQHALESLERWRVYELKNGLTLIDLAARLAILTHEANEYLREADAQAGDWSKT